jgi:hypothetical protein
MPLAVCAGVPGQPFNVTQRCIVDIVEGKKESPE